jgi:type III secretion protein R
VTTSPLTLILAVVGAGLLPFALVMLTSFVKMAVVLSIVRNAMGTPQIPPNSVVTGLALVLSLVVMAPVASLVGERLSGATEVWESGSPQQIFEMVRHAAQPVEEFLKRHADPEHLNMFSEMLDESDQSDGSDQSARSDQGPSWKALVPAFVISQLQEAFRMGFVIFLPFLVLDMLVASILLSLGMHMLSPTTISLPFKLLLFVFADGWTLIGCGLIGAYL